MSNASDGGPAKASVLGPNLVFRGELSAEEDLMLRGQVDGSIRHTASLRIGQEGRVNGDVEAKRITVDGRVEGNLHGSESVTIKSTADVKGDVYSPRVSLIEGARFDGRVHMGNSQEAEPKNNVADNSTTGDASQAESPTKVTALS